MSRNVEIKARLSDPDEIRIIAETIADEGPIEIFQEDTFLFCDAGRLKLRKFSTESGELIYYERADEDGPKESFYIPTPTLGPELLLETLSLAYGISGQGKKRRTLYLVGRTRIHIGQVEGLGDFLELEVVLGEEENSDTACVEARELMRKLRIPGSQLIRGAYVDLLHNNAN